MSKQHYATRAAVGALVLGLTTFSAMAQDDGVMVESPYEYTTESWMEPFADEGFTWGGHSGIVVQSKDRIFVLQRGETELPEEVPSEYTNFAGSLGWNVLQGRGRVWQNCIYVIDSEGNVLEVWDQWDYLFTGTDGPGPHRIRMSPYDPENRLWLIDETGHIIYVFSNDGEQLLMTLGEKNVPGSDETHYNQPQDLVFLPDGKFLVADGLGNNRVVIRDADGSYLGEFGEGGDQPHQYGSVHSMALGPEDKLYVLDRDNRDVKVYQQTAARDSDAYPNYNYETTWDIPGGPLLDVLVSDKYAWVTVFGPARTHQFDLDGNKLYTWNLPSEGPDRWLEMHSLAVDEDGNLYGTDNQLARPQKLIPRTDIDPELIIRPQYVPR